MLELDFEKKKTLKTLWKTQKCKRDLLERCQRRVLLQRGSDLRRAVGSNMIALQAASVDIKNERLEEKKATASKKSSGVLDF